MITFEEDNFELVFEAKGLKPLFQSFSLNNFMQPESILYIKGELGAYYISKKSVVQMREFGRKLYSNQVSFFGDIDSCLKKAYILNEEIKQSKDISVDTVKAVFHFLKEFEQAFKYLDNGYLDGAYEAGKESKIALNNIKMIEDYKNSSRVELNKIFFEKDGMWNNVLTKISAKFAISRDDIDWYLENDVFELFNNNKLSDVVISDRKKAIIFYQDDKEGSIIVGQKALDSLNNFFDNSKNSLDKIQIINGRVANRGSLVKSRAFVISADYSNLESLAKEIEKMDRGDVLVSQTTAPELMPALEKASAVVTDIGGMLSHAAISSRELNIPCVIATKNASKIIKTGDLVEVDSEKGVIKIIK